MSQKSALVTGARGFIGNHLSESLRQHGYSVLEFTREHELSDLEDLLRTCDVVFHVAGVNRSESETEFEKVNSRLTDALCTAVENELKIRPRLLPVIFTSSIRSGEPTPYGLSKQRAELRIENFALTGNSKKSRTIRLTNVFGKGCKPNYNSVVATFCSRAWANQELIVDDPNATLRLAFIDDVVEQLMATYLSISESSPPYQIGTLEKYDEVSVGDLASLILKFRRSVDNGVTGAVGTGFNRKLFSTFMSYLPPEKFKYPLDAKVDSRGAFAEVIRTETSGQVSIVRCAPGEIRGNHFHNTKLERFVVVEGRVKAKFRNVFTQVETEILVTSDNLEVIWAVPGWLHSFENIGNSDAILVVWANELFDPEKPDTFRLI